MIDSQNKIAQALTELREEIHELEELMKGGKWDIKDAGYVDKAEVYDERISKLEELDELLEQKDKTELRVLKIKWLQWNGYQGTDKQIAKVILNAETLRRMLAERGVV